MKKILLLSAITLLSYAYASNPIEETTDSFCTQDISVKQQQKKDVDTYFASGITPKVAVYGDGKAYGIRKDYLEVITVDKNPKANPTITADITDMTQMSILPNGKLDRVELLHIDPFHFGKRFTEIFNDISRVLKNGGELRFDNMWRKMSAEDFKKLSLSQQKELKTKNPESYKKLEQMEPKQLIQSQQSQVDLNPFIQYLTMDDHKQMSGKSFDKTHVFEEYKRQLTTSFVKVGFTNLTWNTFGEYGDKGWKPSYWSVCKKTNS